MSNGLKKERMKKPTLTPH